ncbi:flagellar assembly protein FlgT [Parashewanella spongiae]|nr:flagellar assembly protein T N-terminal domain-containing protein [Parashewanella spongiae]MCL1076597.1 flagellar assembly protein FlgT [Parashewanella spongiae]
MRSITNNLFIICMSFAVFSYDTQAEWLTVSGEALIMNNEVNSARNEAINNALKSASFYHGIQINSTQEFQNGKLLSDNITLENPPNSQKFEFVSEQIRNNIIHVEIRIDTDVHNKNTDQLSSGKSIVFIPQATVKDRTQLRYGQLYGFEEAISEQIGRSLTKHSQLTLANVHATERLDHQQNTFNNTNELPKWISLKTDSQYILTPTVLNIAPETAKTGPLGFWKVSQSRQFRIRFSLYHGISGENIWNRVYSTSADWDFKPHEIISPFSDEFWNSEYGEEIEHTLEKASHEMDEALKERPLMGQIISIDNYQMIINLGRKHGMVVGDTLKIVLKNDLPDRLNVSRIIAIKSKASVHVTQLTESTAVVRWSNPKILENIQIDDIVLKI